MTAPKKAFVLVDKTNNLALIINTILTSFYYLCAES